ncbi:MAG: phytanoyl-CoA dioxygenase family protein [Acidimicrobiales bacterium]
MVADDAVVAFAQDGVVVVRGLMTANELEMISAGINKVLANPSSAARVVSADDDPGLFFEDFSRWGEIDELGKVALRSAVPRTAAELMDSPTARFYHDHILVKEPETIQPTPWHQDAPYYNVEGRGISAWIPVDPIPKEGSPEFWAGSHLGPWRLPRSFLDQQAKWFPEGTLAEVPDIDADRSSYDIRRWALDPGDVVFFDFATVHSAPGFPFSYRRRVLSLRFLSADARHAPRPWPTSPEFPGLSRDLPDGAEFDHPYFPLAWPR